MLDYFISDLHLSADYTEHASLLNQHWQRFIDQHAPRMARLFILGDLVDSWIGDDDDSDWAKQLCRQLKQLSDAGVAVHFLHGNRDFLVGPEFAKRCGLTLLPEQFDVVRGLWRLRVSHGDELCTSDLAYQQFRQQVRQPAWQSAFLSQSLIARRAFAASARAQSQQHQQSIDRAITDVDPVAVAAAFEALQIASGPRVLLHGHTHRPAIHRSELGIRIVLGDWLAQSDGQSWLHIDSDGHATLAAHGWQENFSVKVFS
jgi:UDP-2,3-diacylglucosamine hydrolase